MGQVAPVLVPAKTLGSRRGNPRDGVPNRHPGSADPRATSGRRGAYLVAELATSESVRWQQCAIAFACSGFSLIRAPARHGPGQTRPASPRPPLVAATVLLRLPPQACQSSKRARLLGCEPRGAAPERPALATSVALTRSQCAPGVSPAASSRYPCAPAHRAGPASYSGYPYPRWRRIAAPPAFPAPASGRH